MLFYRLIPSSKWNSLFYRSSKGPAYSLSMQRQLRFRPSCSVTPWIRSFPPRLRLAEIKEILSHRAERPPERRMDVNAPILSESGALETHLEWLWLKDRMIYLQNIVSSGRSNMALSSDYNLYNIHFKYVNCILLNTVKITVWSLGFQKKYNWPTYLLLGYKSIFTS